MIRPLAKNMLIKKIKEEKPSLIIVQTSITGPFKAVLISKGNQVDLEVEIGDILLINQFGPVQFDKEDDEHLLITERDVLGVII
jgi:co-chaperonin GroES (HSP10)